MGARRKRIFLVDSHDIYRTGMRSVLDDADDLEVVGEASRLGEDYHQVVRTGADVTIVGLRDGEHPQLQDLDPLARQHPEIGVLVLARDETPEALDAAVAVGARAYSTKDISVEELRRLIGSVASGDNLIDSQRARTIVRQRSPEPDPFDSLTRQERRILALVAGGLSNREIAEELFLVEKTVRNHVTRVLAKLGAKRRTQAALIASRHGLTADTLS